MKCENCGHEINAGRLLGLVKSEKKAASSRKNGLKGGAKKFRKALDDAFVAGLTVSLSPEDYVISCQSPYCKNIGKEVMIHGMKAWLCEDHS